MIDSKMIQQLKQEMATLERMITDSEKELSKSPAGSVQIRKHGKSVQFYHYGNSGQKNGKYIPAGDAKQAVELVKKRYLTKIIDAARKQASAIDAFLKEYSCDAIKDIYSTEGEIRQSIIYTSFYDRISNSGTISIPDSIVENGRYKSTARDLPSQDILKKHRAELLSMYPSSAKISSGQPSTMLPSSIQPSTMLPDKEYAALWESLTYQGKTFRDDIPLHYTQKHERVRSKSEVLIADILGDRGIPYKYECPLRIGNQTIYPDFTILRIRDRKQLYWEHLGLFDDSEYSTNAVSRINLYEANGIFPGDNLIISFETQKNPLNRLIVERLIQQYIL